MFIGVELWPDPTWSQFPQDSRYKSCGGLCWWIFGKSFGSHISLYRSIQYVLFRPMVAHSKQLYMMCIYIYILELWIHGQKQEMSGSSYFPESRSPLIRSYRSSTHRSYRNKTVLSPTWRWVRSRPTTQLDQPGQMDDDDLFCWSICVWPESRWTAGSTSATCRKEDLDSGFWLWPSRGLIASFAPWAILVLYRIIRFKGFCPTHVAWSQLIPNHPSSISAMCQSFVLG